MRIVASLIVSLLVPLPAVIHAAAVAPVATPDPAPADTHRVIAMHVGIPGRVYLGQPLKELVENFPMARVMPYAGQNDAKHVQIADAGISCIVTGSTPEELRVSSVGFNFDLRYEGVAGGDFRTIEGIGRGSTVEDLVRAFGPPSEVIAPKSNKPLAKPAALTTPTHPTSISTTTRKAPSRPTSSSSGVRCDACRSTTSRPSIDISCGGRRKPPLPEMSGPAVDLAVVGGGVIGLSIARAAARRGLSVTLLERDRPGRAASRAAAGLLSPQLEASRPGPLLTLGLASRTLYPTFLRALREESGVDPGLRSEGTLLIARSTDDLVHLERVAAFQSAAGLRLSLLPPGEAARLEPSLAPGVLGGLHLPDDISLDSSRLLLALHRCALLSGVDIRSGVPVTRVTTAAGRVTGVETSEGALAAGAVVVAAGAWTGQVEIAGAVPLPSHPVRGQILCLASERSGLRHVVVTRDHHYLVPRLDGRILVGSTMERVGFDTSVTASAVARLAAAAIEEAPELAQARVHGAWAGLRPATPDGLPAIGRGGPRGLFYACGHLRNGILLAPITAQAIVAMACGESPGVDLSGCEPERFTRPSPAGETIRAARPGPRPPT